MFTNLATGSELYTVMAPGSEINSLNAADNGYMMESGTSMAAPVVSGALALVAQAYPWMTGKQLADSVLTTANRDFEAPPYTVLYTTPPENKESNLVETVRLVIIAKDKKEADQIWKNGSTTIEAGGKTYTVNLKNPDIDTIKALVQNHIDLDEKAWLGWSSYALQKLEEGENLEIKVLTKEQVFGQGILDVSKAVRGPALLDANRMTVDNVVRVEELDKEFALETFDTKGYVAEFANDIAQRVWDDNYHHADLQTTGKDPEQAEDA